MKPTKLTVLALMGLLLLMAIVGSVYAILLFLGYTDLSSFVFPYASYLNRIVGYAIDLIILFTIATSLSTKRTRRRLDQLWKPRLLWIVSQTQTRMNVSKTVKPSVWPRAANAGYAGFNRILVGEKLLQNMDDQELAGVIGHELAHGIRHHMIPMVMATVTAFALAFFAPYYIGSSPEIDVLLRTLFAVALFASIPLWWRIEYCADRTAAERLGPETLIRMLTKLRSMTFDGISFTHPPLSRRIARMEDMQSVHDIPNFAIQKPPGQ